MAIYASIHHLTHYRYDRNVTMGPQIIRLRPAPYSRTRVISHSLKVSPQPHFVNHQQDPYGNWLARYVFPEPVREFRIEVDVVADMSVYNPFDFFVEEAAEFYPFDYPAELADDLSIYRRVEPATPLLAEFVAQVPRARTRIVDWLVMLNARVASGIEYTIRMEAGVQTPEETLQKALGSCRDSSWLLVNVLRHLGLAARFVSGYLIQLKPDLDALDGPSGTQHDFTDLHAWVEVYLPGAGWIGLDPTSGLFAGESHIPLAATPHYQNAAPISGGYTAAGSPEVTFDFDMTVARVAEHPRITKPFSDESWQRLNALGRQVDTALETGDVRLTMGGEPTFVSIDDYEIPRVEHRRRRPDEARPCRPADPPPARPLRTRRIPALRAGQVVSRGNAAALDLLALLAPRRQADLGRCRSCRARGCRHRGGRRQRRGVHHRFRAGAGNRAGDGRARL